MSKYVAMWSGPRNISTALMRSFENRPDCFVSDEPFYAHYLHKTGVDHPLRNEIISAGNTDWDDIVREITNPIPKNKKIWYQKHMAQHNFPKLDLKWTENMQNCFLIRHPKEVILSYSRKYKINSIYQLGYPQLTDLFKILNSRNDNVIIILDSRDVLADPEGMLTKLCDKLTIPFYSEMLNWASGSRESDGIWGKYWYGSVEASTGFQPYRERELDLPDKYENMYLKCMDYYEQLYKYRLY